MIKDAELDDPRDDNKLLNKSPCLKKRKVVSVEAEHTAITSCFLCFEFSGE